MSKTFEDLCPVWSKRVTELEDIEKFRKYSDDMHTYEFCIVGEAHLDIPFEEQKHKLEHHDPRYNKKFWFRDCYQCVELSQKIAIAYSTYRKAMLDFIAEFVEHFNDKHAPKSPIAGKGVAAS